MSSAKNKKRTHDRHDANAAQWTLESGKHEVLGQLAGYNLRRAHGVQQQRFAAAFGRYEMRPVLLSILGLIFHNPGLRQADLGRVLDIKRANIVTLLAELEERRLIRREPSPNDKRSRVLALTSKGDALTRKLLDRHDRFEEDLKKRLGAKEHAQLIKLLKAYRQLPMPDDLSE
jgi:DNA-binding MarR family transcriptional regulator